MARFSSPSAPLSSLRALAARLGALALVGLLILASLNAGKAYWWCIPMQQAMFEPCCGDEGGDEGEAVAHDEGSKVQRECCIGGRIGGLPAASSSSAPERLSLAPAAILTLPLRAALPSAAPAPRPIRLHAAQLRRHGPTRDGPRFASDRCTQLQVYRC